MTINGTDHKCTYRVRLGNPINICMACAAKLESERALAYGLCDKHWAQILQPAQPVQRAFGRGIEYQLLHHTDELDDILFKAEHDDDPSQYFSSDWTTPETRVYQARAAKCTGADVDSYRIYLHYLAKIFLAFLRITVDLCSFDYVVFSSPSLLRLHTLLSEMGYLSKDREIANLFIKRDLTYELVEERFLLPIKGKRILVLGIYGTPETRDCMDHLRLEGATVTTAYLTSFS